jgi:hypothetical protein
LKEGQCCQAHGLSDSTELAEVSSRRPLNSKTSTQATICPKNSKVSNRKDTAERPIRNTLPTEKSPAAPKCFTPAGMTEPGTGCQQTGSGSHAGTAAPSITCRQHPGHKQLSGVGCSCSGFQGSLQPQPATLLADRRRSTVFSKTEKTRVEVRTLAFAAASSRRSAHRPIRRPDPTSFPPS